MSSDIEIKKEPLSPSSDESINTMSFHKTVGPAPLTGTDYSQVPRMIVNPIKKETTSEVPDNLRSLLPSVVTSNTTTSINSTSSSTFPVSTYGADHTGTQNNMLVQNTMNTNLIQPTIPLFYCNTLIGSIVLGTNMSVTSANPVVQTVQQQQPPVDVVSSSPLQPSQLGLPIVCIGPAVTTSLMTVSRPVTKTSTKSSSKLFCQSLAVSGKREIRPKYDSQVSMAIPSISPSSDTDPTLPKIESCYSMKKLTLTEMIEVMDSGYDLVKMARPFTDEQMRAKIFCDRAKKFGVTGIHSGIDERFYSSLICPFIFDFETKLLKKHVEETLETRHSYSLPEESDNDDDDDDDDGTDTDNGDDGILASSVFSDYQKMETEAFKKACIMNSNDDDGDYDDDEMNNSGSCESSIVCSSKFLPKWNSSILLLYNFDFEIQKYCAKHGKSLNFYCYLCSFKTNDHDHIYHHVVKAHTGQSPADVQCYKCTHCPIDKFPDFLSLKKHELNDHLSDSPCYFCGKAVYSQIELVKHIIVDHSDEVNSAENSEPELKKEGSFNCPYCFEKFLNWDCIEMHLHQIHINSPVPNKMEQTCFSCRHVFVDDNALMYHCFSMNSGIQPPHYDTRLLASSTNHFQNGNIYLTASGTLLNLMYYDLRFNFDYVWWEEYVTKVEGVQRTVCVNGKSFTYPYGDLIYTCAVCEALFIENLVDVFDTLIQKTVLIFEQLQNDEEIHLSRKVYEMIALVFKSNSFFVYLKSVGYADKLILFRRFSHICVADDKLGEMFIKRKQYPLKEIMQVCAVENFNLPIIHDIIDGLLWLIFTDFSDLVPAACFKSFDFLEMIAVASRTYLFSSILRMVMLEPLPINNRVGFHIGSFLTKYCNPKTHSDMTSKKLNALSSKVITALNGSITSENHEKKRNKRTSSSAKSKVHLSQLEFHQENIKLAKEVISAVSSGSSKLNKQTHSYKLLASMNKYRNPLKLQIFDLEYWTNLSNRLMSDFLTVQEQYDQRKKSPIINKLHDKLISRSLEEISSERESSSGKENSTEVTNSSEIENSSEITKSLREESPIINKLHDKLIRRSKEEMSSEMESSSGNESSSVATNCSGQESSSDVTKSLGKENSSEVTNSSGQESSSDMTSSSGKESSSDMTSSSGQESSSDMTSSSGQEYSSDVTSSSVKDKSSVDYTKYGAIDNLKIEGTEKLQSSGKVLTDNKIKENIHVFSSDKNCSSETESRFGKVDSCVQGEEFSDNLNEESNQDEKVKNSILKRSSIKAVAKFPSCDKTPDGMKCCVVVLENQNLCKTTTYNNETGDTVLRNKATKYSTKRKLCKIQEHEPDEVINQNKKKCILENAVCLEESEKISSKYLRQRRKNVNYYESDLDSDNDDDSDDDDDDDDMDDSSNTVLENNEITSDGSTKVGPTSHLSWNFYIRNFYKDGGSIAVINPITGLMKPKEEEFENDCETELNGRPSMKNNDGKRLCVTNDSIDHMNDKVNPHDSDIIRNISSIAPQVSAIKQEPIDFDPVIKEEPIDSDRVMMREFYKDSSPTSDASHNILGLSSIKPSSSNLAKNFLVSNKRIPTSTSNHDDIISQARARIKARLSSASTVVNEVIDVVKPVIQNSTSCDEKVQSGANQSLVFGPDGSISGTLLFSQGTRTERNSSNVDEKISTQDSDCAGNVNSDINNTSSLFLPSKYYGEIEKVLPLSDNPNETMFIVKYTSGTQKIMTVDRKVKVVEPKDVKQTPKKSATLVRRKKQVEVKIVDQKDLKHPPKKSATLISGNEQIEVKVVDPEDLKQPQKFASLISGNKKVENQEVDHPRKKCSNKQPTIIPSTKLSHDQKRSKSTKSVSLLDKGPFKNQIAQQPSSQAQTVQGLQTPNSSKSVQGLQTPNSPNIVPGSNIQNRVYIIQKPNNVQVSQSQNSSYLNQGLQSQNSAKTVPGLQTQNSANTVQRLQTQNSNNTVQRLQTKNSANTVPGLQTQNSANAGQGLQTQNPANIVPGLQTQNPANTVPGLQTKNSANTFQGLQTQNSANTVQGLQTQNPANTVPGLQTKNSANTFQGLQTQNSANTVQGLQTQNSANTVPGLQTQNSANTVQRLQTKNSANTVPGLQTQNLANTVQRLQTQNSANTVQRLQTQNSADTVQRLQTQNSADTVQRLQTQNSADTVQRLQTQNSCQQIIPTPGVPLLVQTPYGLQQIVLPSSNFNLPSTTLSGAAPSSTEIPPTILTNPQQSNVLQNILPQTASNNFLYASGGNIQLVNTPTGPLFITSNNNQLTSIPQVPPLIRMKNKNDKT